MTTCFALVGFLVALAAVPAAAGTPPVPPCAGEPSPAPAALGAAPVVAVWPQGSLGVNWTPPACSAWRTSGFQSLIAVAGRFRLAGGDTALLTRIGAVSKTAGIRYWSVSSRSWKTLVTTAHAGADTPRADFAPPEFTPGAALDFSQTDGGTGRVSFRFDVLVRTPQRIVLSSRNITAARFLLVTLFHPGDLETLWVFDRESVDVWRAYSLTRVGPGANALASGHETSGINRAVAFWRYFAGVPTDAEPPAAP
jgi:hypothetical protein